MVINFTRTDRRLGTSKTVAALAVGLLESPYVDGKQHGTAIYYKEDK